MSSFNVAELRAVNGNESVSLGPMPLNSTGATIKQKIAQKIGKQASGLALYFEGGPFQDTETLEDVGANLDGDQVTYTVLVPGGRK